MCVLFQLMPMERAVWTYAIASKLPTTLLDGLLTLPHALLSIRTALMAARDGNTARQLPHLTASDVPAPLPPAAPESDTDHEMLSENGSDADVESSSGYRSGVGDSWISLHRDIAEHEQPWR